MGRKKVISVKKTLNKKEIKKKKEKRETTQKTTKKTLTKKDRKKQVSDELEYLGTVETNTQEEEYNANEEEEPQANDEGKQYEDPEETAKDVEAKKGNDEPVESEEDGEAADADETSEGMKEAVKEREADDQDADETSEGMKEAVKEREADDQDAEEEPIGEVQMSEEHEDPEQLTRKKQRGPTKMKNIAKDPNSRVKVEFNDMGEPVGPGSVLLSSYLGPLVREHVPVIIDDWRKITEEMKTVLWMSIQARFEIDEELQKAAVMKQMGGLWRASKSRLVTKLRNEASTNQERMNLRPKNVSPFEWRKFVKLKTSQAFKVVSDSYKERRRLQIPHTSSRKGIVRLAEDMKKESGDPSQVSRIKVWVKSRTKKDGTPVNMKAAEKFKQAAEILNRDSQSNSTNPREDELTQLLGPDNPGRIRAMGRSMNLTKLACFQVKKHFMTQMEEKQYRLMDKVSELEDELSKIKKLRQEPEVGENSADARSVKSRTGPKCVLVDWDITDDNVAEGRIVSSDPKDFVNDVPLGPNAFKVLVEAAIKPDAFLWRPGSEMYTVEQAIGEMIAWPDNKCVISDSVLHAEDIPLSSPRMDSLNQCKLLDWAQSDEVVVAEGRWQCQEPTALVNGVPLGPSAVKVFVDVVHEPETFLWRPTKEKPYLGHSLKSFVAWPVKKCMFKGSTCGTFQRSPIQITTTSGKAASSKSSPEGPVSASPKGSVSVSPKGTGSVSPKGSVSVSPKGSASASPKGSGYALPKVPESESPSSKSPKKKSQPSCLKGQVVKKIKPSPQSPPRRSMRHGPTEVPKENQKCKLMDIGGKKQVVAEGRWSSDNPEVTCHFVPLGPNAVKVWVDVVKVKNAAVWRSSTEIECMGDAIGSTIAWPKDKVSLC